MHYTWILIFNNLRKKATLNSVTFLQKNFVYRAPPSFLWTGSVYQFRVDRWLMDTFHLKENLVFCHIDSFSLVIYIKPSLVFEWPFAPMLYILPSVYKKIRYMVEHFRMVSLMCKVFILVLAWVIILCYIYFPSWYNGKRLALGTFCA